MNAKAALGKFSSLGRRLKRRAALRGAHPWEHITPADEGKFYHLAVCAIFKNEAAYMKEWLDFHRLVGVEKFFLYDNNSDDDYLPILEPYVAEGVVTLHHLPLAPPVQLVAYDACLNTYRQHARWIAFIDFDEFLFSPGCDSVPEVLAGYEQYPAVAVSWLMFSTSGHILKPQGMVIENFTRCQEGGNRHVKLVLQPAKTERFVSSHQAAYYGGRLAVNAERREVAGCYSEPPCLEHLRINHYWTKSVEEFFMIKLSRGFVDGISTARDISGLVMAEQHYNARDDYTIQRFVPKLKRMEGAR